MTRIDRAAVILLLLTGCNRMDSPQSPDLTTPASSTAPVGETPVKATLVAEGNATQMTQPLPTPSNSGLQSLIEQAREDLAQRLAISIDQISLVDATEAEWSDSSLDCPQPGMEYLQVITPGYRILLESGDSLYEYHSNKDIYFVYCENPDSPALPKP